MGKLIISGVLILSLASFSVCNASMAVIKGKAGAQGGQSGPSGPLTQQTVINIAVSKIENGAIYSKNGQKYDISGAIVVNSSQSRDRITGAELDFLNGKLVQVIFK